MSSTVTHFTKIFPKRCQTYGTKGANNFCTKVSLGNKRVSRQEVSSVALNSHKISYD